MNQRLNLRRKSFRLNIVVLFKTLVTSTVGGVCIISYVSGLVVFSGIGVS